MRIRKGRITDDWMDTPFLQITRWQQKWPDVFSYKFLVRNKSCENGLTETFEYFIVGCKLYIMYYIYIVSL